MQSNTLTIPDEIAAVINRLVKAGHKSYIVGGCVRDILRGAEPKDWDVATSAKPEEIVALFPESFYENAFLTVTVRTGSSVPELAEVEITTFRREGKYTDKRHPDTVAFAETLEEDLARRDFTINALALSEVEGSGVEAMAMAIPPSSIPASPIPNPPIPGYILIDPFDGQNDLRQKLIRCVGDPAERFAEDALRMIRAVRFAAELDFIIEEKTRTAICENAGLLEFIAKERIRDELYKILSSTRARQGVELLHDLGALKYILPELEEGIGVENRPKIFTIWEHNLKALEYGATHNFPLDVRIAALLHDVGKPRTKGPMKNNEWTFYGHDVVGGKMTNRALARLRASREQTEKIALLIRWHLFKYDMDRDDVVTTDSSIRRLIRRVGAGNMPDLVKLRICDRMGMGVPKAVPYRLRHFQFRVEKILREEEAPGPKMLTINGDDIMATLDIGPGQRIGRIIEVLLQETIDDPSANTRDALLRRVREIGTLSDEELERMARAAEEKVEMIEDERIGRIKQKYYVK
ncbi:MAG: CCA tRNA nucleotidyltransferase [Patescibacteria group bacterium]